MRALPGISALCVLGLIAGAATSAPGAAGDVITAYGASGTVAATGFSGYQGMGSELDSQGRLLMASASSQGLAVNRVTAAGAIDTGFGTSGTALASVDPSYATSDVIAVDSQDRAVLASYTFNGTSGEFEGYAQRYDANGDPDATFGLGGAGDRAGAALRRGRGHRRERPGAAGGLRGGGSRRRAAHHHRQPRHQLRR